MQIIKHHYEEGDTAGWLKLRSELKGKLGGSEIGTVAGHSSYCSPFSLFCQKTGAIKTPLIQKKEAIIQGHDGEDGVAKRFEREMGKKVHRENCIMENPAYPHLKSSVDRMIYGEKSGLECKTAKDMAMKKYKHGDFPLSYFDQCLSYLAVTQMERWYLAIQVFGTAFRIFLMTTIKAEADRYQELKDKFFEWQNFKSRNFMEWTYSVAEKKFVYEGEDKSKELEIPDGIADVNDTDLEEWETKWCKLEAVYYVDEEEFAACESFAKTFVDRLKVIEDYMSEWKPDHECSGAEYEDLRMAALISATRQVWPMDEIDGSESTSETVAEIAPDVIVNTVETFDESSPMFELVQRRDEIAKEIKAKEAELEQIENQVALTVGQTETVMLPGWKVTYKMGNGRETASAAKVKEYFASKGQTVPEGLISVSEGKRSLRFWTAKAKAKNGSK